MSGGMPDRIPEYMSDRMPDRMSEFMSNRVPEYMSDRVPDRMPDRMSEYMSDRMSAYIKYMFNYTSWHVMVGITRSKVFFLASASFIPLPPAGECAIRRRGSCGPGKGALRYHFIVFHVCLLVGASVFNHWQDQSLDELLVILNLSISQDLSSSFGSVLLRSVGQGVTRVNFWFRSHHQTSRQLHAVSHSNYGTCLLAVARGICNSRCSATDFWRRFDQSLQGSQSLISGFALIIWRRKD